MSEKLREIQREVASLKKDLEKLRRFQSDCEEVKKLRKRLVETGFD